jgi:tape measure domain-containing protein
VAQLAFDIVANDRASKVFDQVGAKAKGTNANFTKVGTGMTGMIGKISGAVGGLAVGWQAWDKIMVGGFNRLANLDDARKRLDQMGLSTSEAAKLMDGLKDTVTGTAFSLDAGAGAMTQFVSAGVDLDDVNQRLQMTADTAAFAQAPLDEIGNIFVKIQTQGKIMGEELNMLQERGVPALLLLADAAGVTAEQMRDMISRGEIDAERFFDLWEQGSKGFGENNIKIEGAAKSMGDTIRGSLANAETAMARLGETILEDFMPAVKGIADGFKGAADGVIAFLDATEPVRDFFGDTIGQLIEWDKEILEFLGIMEDEGPAKTFQSSMDGAKSSAEGLGGAAVTAGDNTDGLTTSLEYAEQIAKDARDAIDGLKDSLFETGQEALNLEERQDALATAIAKAKDVSKDDEASKLDQRDAMRGVAEQAHALIETMVEQGASTDAVVGKTEKAREKFLDVADAMGIDSKEAERLADKYGLIPDDVKTTVELIGAQRAKDEAGKVQAALQAIKNRIVTVTIREQVQRIYRPPGGGGFITEFHQGGVIGGGGLRRGHDGLVFRPDERLVIGQTGERILSRKQTQAFHELMSDMGRPTGGSARRPSGGGGLDYDKQAEAFVRAMRRAGIVMPRVDAARQANLYGRGG